MEKRQFGNTGLSVTTLGYGAMELQYVDDAQAERLLNGVLDAGINFIDTAPHYGTSESMIGKFIAGRRAEFFLATKCGCNVPLRGGVDAPRHIYTGTQVRHNIEHSLRRLQTDYVDVWQVHSAKPAELVGSDVLETMLKIKAEGKVLHIAASVRYDYESFRGYLDGEWGDFEAFQVPYSAMDRVSENAISEADKRGIGMIIRGAVHSIDPWKGLADAVTQLDLDDLRAPGESIAQFLIRFALAHPGLHTNIVGTRNLKHLAENIKAAEAGPLADDVLAEAKKRLDLAGIRPSD